MNPRRRSTKITSLILWIMLTALVAVITYNISSAYSLKKVEYRERIQRTVHPIARSRVGRRSRRFHVAVTAEDTPYSKWQCRVMYYWFKKFKDGGGSDMGGYTRILHSGRPDNLVDEIPTFVVDPLPNGMDRDYPVLNRPWAFVQWLEKAQIEEDYILMGEPDHIIMRPIPNLSYGGDPAAYDFFYMKPEENERLLRKFYPEEKGPISAVQPIGNSPVIIRKELLRQIAPTWVNVSILIRYDAEANEKFGWVQEMYAYAVAAALHGVRHRLWKDFMVQPPWDTDVGEAFILHFTYSCDYNAKGELTYGQKGAWRFDKRDYLVHQPPRNLPPPIPGVPEVMVRLIKMINEAGSNLPNWDTT